MTIITALSRLTRTLPDEGFSAEGETIQAWLEQTSDETKDNMDRHLVWRQVYDAIHQDLENADLTLSCLASEANSLEQAMNDLDPLPPIEPFVQVSDSVLAQIVITRLIESESFYLLLAIALKDRINAY